MEGGRVTDVVRRSSFLSGGLVKAITEAPAELAAELQAALVRVGNEHTARVKTRQFGPWQDKPYAEKLRTRGGTINRVRSDLPRRGTSLAALRLTQLVSGANVTTQEFGGRIAGKRFRNVKIPLKDALTPSGRLKGEAVMHKGTFGWETAKGERSFLIRTRQSALVAVRRGRRVVPLYLLTESVTLPTPGRLKFYETWLQMQPFTEIQLESAAASAMAKAARRISGS